MVELQQVAKATGTSFKTYLKVFGITLLFIIFIVIFIDSIIQSFKEHSIRPFLTEVGNRIILASQSLQTESRAIITSGGIYQFDEGVVKGGWNTFNQLSKWIGALMLVLAWIRVLAFFVSKTPYELNAFNRYSLAIILFYVIQVIASIGTASITGNVTGFAGGDESLTHYFLLPITSVIVFFQSLPYIFDPLTKFAKLIEKIS